MRTLYERSPCVDAILGIAFAVSVLLTASLVTSLRVIVEFASNSMEGELIGGIAIPALDTSPFIIYSICSGIFAVATSIFLFIIGTTTSNYNLENGFAASYGYLWTYCILSIIPTLFSSVSDFPTAIVTFGITAIFGTILILLFSYVGKKIGRITLT